MQFLFLLILLVFKRICVSILEMHLLFLYFHGFLYIINTLNMTVYLFFPSFHIPALFFTWILEYLKTLKKHLLLTFPFKNNVSIFLVLYHIEIRFDFFLYKISRLNIFISILKVIRHILANMIEILLSPLLSPQKGHC